MRAPFLLAALAACSGGSRDTNTSTTTPLQCADIAMKDDQGAVDPCDLQACQACADACDGDCVVAQSYPVQYHCPEGSWTVYDFCPDWTLGNGSSCEDTTSTLTPSDMSALGFSGDDVLAALAGPFDSPAEYVAEEGRPDTTISIAITANGDPVFHDREPSGTTTLTWDGPVPACNDFLEVPVLVAFSSADGAFAESLPTSITAMELGNLSASSELDWTDLSGSFEFATIVPSEWDSVTLDLGTILVPELQGGVQVSANREIGPNTGEGLVGPVLRWPPIP